MRPVCIWLKMKFYLSVCVWLIMKFYLNRMCDGVCGIENPLMGIKREVNVLLMLFPTVRIITMLLKCD